MVPEPKNEALTALLIYQTKMFFKSEMELRWAQLKKVSFKFISNGSLSITITTINMTVIKKQYGTLKIHSYYNFQAQ